MPNRGLWVPHPNQVVYFRDSGSGNMGDVTDEGNPAARFAIPDTTPDKRWDGAAIVTVKAKFTNGTATSAELFMKKDSTGGLPFDFVLDSWPGKGNVAGGDLDVRVPSEELYLWLAERGEAIVFEWANPDTGNMQWAVELGLVDAS